MIQFTFGSILFYYCIISYTVQKIVLSIKILVSSFKLEFPSLRNSHEDGSLCCHQLFYMIHEETLKNNFVIKTENCFFTIVIHHNYF